MPRILWMSPYSLHDISSGASIHCKTVLEGLVKRGFDVWSCSSFLFDVPGGAKLFNNLHEKLEKSKQNVFEMDEKGIHYIYTRCKSTFESEQTLEEQELFFRVYCEVLDRFRPDFVMAFGTGMISMTCFAEAKRRGIVTIYPVLNGNHGNYSFPDTDLILTDSKASERLYRTRDKIRMIPVGEIFDPQYFVAKKRNPKYVTFINPSFEEGLGIFAKLASYCKEHLPEVRFLVVNSRGNFAENVQYLHAKGNKQNHPFNPKDFDNVDMSPGTNNMRSIYAVTKVLIAPSLWWESWGRVVTEAVYNNIPVIAANSGGLNEAVAGGGILLNAPEHCKQDYYSLPTDEEIKPWFEALQYFLNHNVDALLQRAREQLMQADAPDRLISALIPLVRRTRHNRYGDGFDPNAHVGDLNNLEDAELADIDFS